MRGQTRRAVADRTFVFAASRKLIDDFETIRSRPRGPWYVINWGSEDGEPRRWEGRECGSHSCVRAVTEGGESFARLEVSPSETPGYYVNAELAERRTGYASGEAGAWEPSPGHPVEVEARLRWSPNHDASGGGGAQGSSGVWLWNSPVDMEAEDYADFQAFGLSWITGDSAVLKGLNAAVIRTTPHGPYPVWSAAPERAMDLQAWNDFALRWSADASGGQTVRFSLNGAPVGIARLGEPFGALSLEIWSDNQVPTPYGIDYRNPAADQGFEVERIKVQRR